MRKLIHTIFYKEYIMSLHRYTAPDVGLCNRLRGYVGAAAYAKAKGSTLHVVWDKSHACPYRIQDLFEPLQNTHYMSDISGIQYSHASSNASYLETILSRYRLQTGNAAVLMATLVPIRSIRQEIRNIWDSIPLRDAIGVHIRRTDHTEYALSCGGSTSLETFWSFADKYPDKPIFVACDDSDTLALCREKYGLRVHVAKEFADRDTSSLRKTDGIHAVLDLYCLALCKYFQGSAHSSFTAFVEYLRNAWITHPVYRRRIF